MTNQPTTVTYLVSKQIHSPQLYKDRNRIYLVPFNYSNSQQVVVKINGVSTQEFSLYGTTITLNQQPKDGDEITISRATEPEAPSPSGDIIPTYNAGDSIKAADLNEANSLLLQKIEELQAEIAVLKAQNASLI